MTNPSETQIRELIDRRVAAVRAKDVAPLVEALAPEAVLFDVVPPLQRGGSEAVGAKTAEWFASYDGPIGYDVRDLVITAGEDVAFCRYLYHVSGELKAGGSVSMWVRSTVCFRRIDGAWRIVHEHTSVPFGPESGRASLDLEPPPAPA